MAPFLQAALLMIVLALAGIPFVLVERRAKAERVRRALGDWLLLGWLGVGDAGNTALFFAAYKETSVAIAVLTHYLAPIFVACLAPVVLREQARERTFVAVLVAFSGLVLLLQPWRVGLSRSDVIGGLLGAGSAVFYASNVLVNKRLAKTFTGSELMCFHCAVGAPLLLLLVPRDAYAAAPWSSIGIVVLASIGPGIVGGLCFVWGLKRIPASHASILTLLEPFVALALATVFLGEALGAVPVLGSVLILAGAVLVVTSRPGQTSNAESARRGEDRVSSSP